MPTIPLYTTPADPFASHRVIAPGGYERWMFSAYDPNKDLFFWCMFSKGDPASKRALKRYRRYRRNPTRVRPPTHDLDAIFVATKSNGGDRRFYAPLIASDRELHLEGPMFKVVTQPDRSISLEGILFGTFTENGDEFTALDFRSSTTIDYREWPLQSNGSTDVDHRWSVAGSTFKVRGHFEGMQDSSRPFEGIGCLEYDFGTGPLGWNLSRCITGRAIFNDHVIVFRHVVGMKGERTQTQAFVVKGNGIDSIDTAQVHIDWQDRHAPQIKLGSALSLSNPLQYATMGQPVGRLYEAQSRGQKGYAFCESLPTAGL